jgi:DNA-binding GntR family transcriptional regulator
MAEPCISDVNATPLWEQVAAGIRQSIRAGALRPGDRIVEAQLARQLGISRNPIREALRQLQQQGIIEYRPNIGTLVTHISRADAQLAVEMRAFLEGRAARLILESGNVDGVRSLEETLARFGQLAEDAEVGMAEALDVEFHRRLIDASGSNMLRRVWSTVDPYTWMIMHVWESRPADYRMDFAQLYEDHAIVVSALRSGSIEESERVAHDHMMRRWHLAQSETPA